jgi:shikimate kinase
MKIYISGFMGSGKSYMGKRAAELLGCPEQFADLDDLVVSREQMSIPDIFRLRDEEGFRMAEYHALSAAKEGIIALGGGTLTFTLSAELVRSSGRVIFLDTDFDLCYQRICADGNRPKVAGKDWQSLKLLYDLRQDTYLETANAVFKPGSTEDLAKLIARLR